MTDHPARQAGISARPGRRTLIAAAPLLLAGPALAFPDRPVSLLHGFAPGGSADALSRVLAGPLGATLGQPVVVEARPGAGGMVAAGALHRAAPDGHTLGLMTGGHAVGAAFGRNLAFDPIAGFSWVGQVVEFGFVIIVRADHPAGDLAALLRLAERPEGITFGSAGAGSTHHLVGELLGAMTGARLLHVPYRGEADAITALLGGSLDCAVITTVTATAQLRGGGRLRPLALSLPRRIAAFPGVPAAGETVPGYAVATWAGIAAPPNLPPPVLEALNAALLRTVAQPAVAARLAELVDGEVRTGTPAQLRDLVASETARWRQLITERNIRPD